MNWLRKHLWGIVYGIFISSALVFLITLIIDEFTLLKPIAEQAKWTIQKLDTINSILDWIEFISVFPAIISGILVGLRELFRRFTD